jgi:transcriptional regulator with XRE-family HTH domain
MTFAEILKTERKRLGKTQVEAATLLDLPNRVYWGWEHGEVVPPTVAQEGAIARLTSADQPAPPATQENVLRGTNLEKKARLEALIASPGNGAEPTETRPPAHTDDDYPKTLRCGDCQGGAE